MEEEFHDVVEDDYYSEVTEVDFAKSETVNIINKWVDEETNGTFKQVLKSGKHFQI